MSADNELESATDYLGKHNFKTLVEWFTAEVILNRPADPLLFLQSVIAEKLSERGDGSYSPNDSVEYMK